MKQRYTLLILLFILLIIACRKDKYGCTDPRSSNYDPNADIDNGSCVYNGSNCLSDREGNIAINNQTGVVLFLYKDGVYITCIPAGEESFLIDIPNEKLDVCHLQIWKADSADDPDNPPIENVYRQWSVALSNTTLVQERANWLITVNTEYFGSGTLFFSYPLKDEYNQSVIYQVDIHLNSENGPRIASLLPGIQDKKVSIDYGIHNFYFHYWYSNPESPSGEIIDIGWNHVSDVVINEYHKESSVDIPVFYSNIGKYGELMVYNEADMVLVVYTNNSLVENIVKVHGSRQGLSNIPIQSESVFLIPVGKYNITIKDLQGNNRYTFNNVDILSSERYTIHTSANFRNIRVINQTDEELTLFSENEVYLGLVAGPGISTAAVSISDTIDSLILLNKSKDKFLGFDYTPVVTVDSLSDFEVNTISFIAEWNKIDNNTYESNAIEDNQQTVMTASIQNRDAVVLSFEYNVSSEDDYDYFKFQIDHRTYIANASGETGWEIFSMQLPSGTRTLQWIYKKDNLFSQGRDNVLIRNITIQKQ